MKPLLIPLALAVAAASLALHSACASPQDPPTTYARGTLVRPPPAPTLRPGHGAPTYDPQVKPLGPQPQPKPSRLLPQTERTRREDTIWATGGVPNDAPETPLIDGFIIPFPKGAETDEDKFLTRECAMLANGTKGVWDPLDLRTGWDKAVRKCLAAKLFKACILGVEDIYRARTRDGEVFRDVQAWLKITKPTAFDLERSMCGGLVMPSTSEKMIDDFARPVETLLRGQIQRIFNVR